MPKTKPKAELDRRLEAARGRIDRLKDRIDVAGEEVRAREEERDRLARRIDLHGEDELAGELEEAQRKVAESGDALGQLTDRLKAAEAGLPELEHAAEEADRRRLQAKRDDLRSQLDQQVAELEEVGEAIAERAAAVRATAAEMGQVDAALGYRYGNRYHDATPDIGDWLTWRLRGLARLPYVQPNRARPLAELLARLLEDPAELSGPETGEAA